MRPEIERNLVQGMGWGGVTNKKSIRLPLAAIFFFYIILQVCVGRWLGVGRRGGVSTLLVHHILSYKGPQSTLASK